MFLQTAFHSVDKAIDTIPAHILALSMKIEVLVLYFREIQLEENH